MPDFKGIAKGGWHPKGKDGGKESWRGDFKGIDQVAGWMGKKRDPKTEEEQHIARPLSSLKDPSLFEPPPKHINYHGPAAIPDRVTPDRRGLGAPLSAEETRHQQQRVQQQEAEEEEEASRPAGPPLPYRANTTGLSTDGLPKPPLRRDIEGSGTSSPQPRVQRPVPSLPPRLPSRQGSSPGTMKSASLPPRYDSPAQTPSVDEGGLNQGSLGRLGRAGVGVPGFGIGGSSTNTDNQNTRPSVSRTGSAQSASNGGGHMDELSARLSKRLASPSPSGDSRNGGTSLAQKQAALTTVNSFRKDPSSVSVADARNAASTANNFRERHGEQLSSGRQASKEMDQKYGVTDRFSRLTTTESPRDTGSPPVIQSPTSPPPVSSGSAAAAAKKKPPPPPPKKKELGSMAGAPPPLPLSSKPRQ